LLLSPHGSDGATSTTVIAARPPVADGYDDYDPAVQGSRPAGA